MNPTVAGSGSEGFVSVEEDLSAVPRRTTEYLVARLRTVNRLICVRENVL
jgi:hypothetical protein